MLFKDIVSFFDGCHGFQGGYIRFFRYDFQSFGKLNITIGLEGRFLNGVARKCSVELKIFDVVEVRSDFAGGRGNDISEKVMFSPSGVGGYCIAFGCDFLDIPVTLDAIRRRSDCYVIGKAVEVLEVK
ncbi:hypothetical protein P5705_12420 [Pseudomonas entomophila]|uniref:hypothetical protein n=1 Tax=Pseudomonas entomophila TaxID=312306 RepID=UPI002404CCCA|nr:hypothetical protein [Pseudomonas entomophila]MDF9618453.1 hypothetical protein [Pseudomonas entomophila]